MQTELWESERQRSAQLEKEVTALQEQLRAAALGRRLGPGDEVGTAGSLSGTLTAAFNSARGSVGGPGGPGVPGSVRELETANLRLLEDLNASKNGALAAKAEAEALQ